MAQKTLIVAAEIGASNSDIEIVEEQFLVYWIDGEYIKFVSLENDDTPTFALDLSEFDALAEFVKTMRESQEGSSAKPQS